MAGFPSCSCPPLLSTHGSVLPASRYISKEEDDALVYIGHDSAKRSGGGDAAGGDAAGNGGDAGAGVVSLIAHTSVPYGIKQLKQGAPESSVLADLTNRLKRLLPWLPEPQQATLQAWAISQVRYPLSLADGAACWHLQPPPQQAEAAGQQPASPLILALAFPTAGRRRSWCACVLHATNNAEPRVLLVCYKK